MSAVPTPPALRAPTFAEAVAIDNYKAAVQGALASSDGVGDKLATAAVSVATAYGAVIALVAPKETTAALVTALPFIAFAATVALGLWAQSLGVNLRPSDDLEVVRQDVESLVSRKRMLNRIALVVLAAGLIAAGIIVAEKYKPAEQKAATTPNAIVRLTPDGRREINKICHRVATSLTGVVDVASLGDTWVTIKHPQPACSPAEAELVLPPRDVAVVEGSK